MSQRSMKARSSSSIQSRTSRSSIRSARRRVSKRSWYPRLPSLYTVTSCPRVLEAANHAHLPEAGAKEDRERCVRQRSGDERRGAAHDGVVPAGADEGAVDAAPACPFGDGTADQEDATLAIDRRACARRAT